MSNNRYPKDGYVWGQRIRGRLEKRWVDVVVEDCQEKGLNIHDATRLADEKDGVDLLKILRCVHMHDM